MNLSFLKRRLDIKNFYGLPFSLLFVSFIYFLFLFGGIVEDVFTSDPIVTVDSYIANLLAAFRTEKATEFFFWITLLGTWQIIVLFSIVAISIFLLLKKRQYIFPLLLSILGGELFTYITKFAFHRPRPEVAVYPEFSFSFPSAHATIAIAFYGFLAYVFIRNIKGWGKKIGIIFSCFFLILFIGFSRIYLGVHYLSDVWGGYLLGAIGLILGIGLAEYFLYQHKKKTEFVSQKSKRLTMGLIVFSIVLYVIYAFLSFSQM